MTATQTLFDLTYAVASQLGILKEGEATGGSTTTLIDTTRTEADNYWQGGTAWILRDAGGAGAAPEREYNVITNNVLSTGTVTLKSALTVAVASGDRYALGKRRFGLHKMIEKINQALTTLGGVPLDDTSLTSTTDYEYTLPIAGKMDLRAVYVATDKAMNHWQEVINWQVGNTTGGATNKLILSEELDAGYTMKLVYVANHPMMQAASDKLSEYVRPERVIYSAAAACMRERRQALPGDAAINADITRLETEAQRAEQTFPIRIPTRPGRLVIPGRSTRQTPGSRSGY